ncbi:4'-phosphopantetheinyl transferase superfamily protein [bacterium]|nr:4'-phosphopantetheinyl transferase superfamily protein [bacterium]
MINRTLHTASSSILIWEITESESELIKMLTNFDVYEPEFKQLRTNKRKFEFLAARIALNILASHEVVVDYSSDGKPYCVDNSLKISISHSGSWVVVMVHSTCEVGIDIEVPTDRFLKLYQRFLNKTEQNSLFDANDLRKVQLAWSAKEALYKIIGNEAVNFDKQLEVMDFSLDNVGSFKGIHTVTGKEYTLYYSSNKAFNLVYCIDN